ncbi:MAG: hypothetical protein QW358_04875, partial [Candidatus Hadarchaeum sp.]
VHRTLLPVGVSLPFMPGELLDADGHLFGGQGQTRVVHGQGLGGEVGQMVQAPQEVADQHHKRELSDHFFAVHQAGGGLKDYGQIAGAGFGVRFGRPVLHWQGVLDEAGSAIVEERGAVTRGPGLQEAQSSPPPAPASPQSDPPHMLHCQKKVREIINGPANESETQGQAASRRKFRFLGKRRKEDERPGAGMAGLGNPLPGKMKSRKIPRVPASPLTAGMGTGILGLEKEDIPAGETLRTRSTLLAEGGAKQLLQGPAQTTAHGAALIRRHGQRVLGFQCQIYG